MNILRIIGSGTLGALHLTQEALWHLKKSKKILWLGTIEGIRELISENQLNGEDITFLYENSALDSDNYSRIKSKVIVELEKFRDIALIVLGHPRLGVTIVQEFQQEVSEKNIELRVIAGLSSFDTMINDLKLDPIEEGSCLIDVNRLLLYDYHMEPSLNYFIYHVCSIGNSNTDYEQPSGNNAAIFLQQKLLKHFPKNHEIILISSRGSISEESRFLHGTISTLIELLENVSFSSSLFIPHCLPKANNINRDFLNLITRRAANV